MRDDSVSLIVEAIFRNRRGKLTDDDLKVAEVIANTWQERCWSGTELPVLRQRNR